MPPTLVVFVDAYPYERFDDKSAPFLRSLGEHAPLTPGIGYSVNIYYELYAGLTPDKIGFFNKWNPRATPRATTLAQDAAYGALDAFRFNQPLSRFVHKLYQRANKTSNLANIPFRYLKFFEDRESIGVFKDRSVPTIFNQNDFDVILSSKGPGDNMKGEQDANGFRAAAEKAASGRNIFLMTANLDALGHKRGLDHADYVEHQRRIDGMCEDLVRRFRAENGDDAPVVVLSDHGMAPVTAGDRLRLEKTFGPIGPRSYMYFADSVFLRVWAADEGLRSRIRAHLEGLGTGRVLVEAERSQWGITDRSFGDLIFILDEGRLFYPGFMGGFRDKAMHGYDPRLRSQQGVFVVDAPGVSIKKGGIEARDAYVVFNDVLKRAASPTRQ